MGNANPRIHLPLPPLHCQPAHPQSSPTIQRQQRRPEHLARLADLQEPSLRIDDRGGLLHRMGALHTPFLRVIVRPCRGHFPYFQLSIARHPQRRVLLRSLGTGLYGRSVRTIQHDDHHGGFMSHLRPRRVAYRLTRRWQQGHRSAHHLLRPLRLRLGKQHQSHTRLRGTAMRDGSVWKMVRGFVHRRQLRLLDRHPDRGAASGVGWRQVYRLDRVRGSLLWSGADMLRLG